MNTNHTPGPWAAKAEGGKFLDADGWYASHDGNEDTCFVPIHKNGKVVALVVSTGSYLETERAVKKHSAEIVSACNAHEYLLAALQDAIETIKAMSGKDLSCDPHEDVSGLEEVIAKATGSKHG